MRRSTPRRSSDRPSWWGLRAAAIAALVLAGLGILGYLVTHGDQVLSYRAWRLQRVTVEVAGHLDTLLSVAGEMEELALAPPGSLVEVNDRLAAMDGRLAGIARRMQEIEAPPALAGHLSRIEAVLVSFGEAMTLEQQALALPGDVRLRADLLSRIAEIRAELEYLKDALRVDKSAADDPPDPRRAWRTCLPVLGKAAGGR